MYDEKKIVETLHFCNEAGLLAHTPRSGFAFLGSGKQSVAEHSFRVALIAFALADMVKEEMEVDRAKLLAMSLFHDFPEARTGDLNYVNKRYVQADEQKAIEEIRQAYPFGGEIFTLLKEYREGETVEAQLAHDADQLELMLMLKKELELGNAFAENWMQNVEKRLHTFAAKTLADKVRQVSSHTWWSGIS